MPSKSSPNWENHHWFSIISYLATPVTVGSAKKNGPYTLVLDTAQKIFNLEEPLFCYTQKHAEPQMAKYKLYIWYFFSTQIKGSFDTKYEILEKLSSCRWTFIWLHISIHLKKFFNFQISCSLYCLQSFL